MAAIYQECRVSQVDTEYKASITGRPFLFNETVIVAEFLLDGIDKQEIARRVVEENLFQVQSVHSRRFTFGVVMRRLKHAPSELLRFLAHGEPKLARLASLYLMLREFRLLREISAELLADKLLLFDETLSQGEVERFLEHKRDHSDVIAGWSEKTFEKVRRNAMRVTNLSFGEWVEVFGDEKLTTALLDRLGHHAHVLTTRGESYRTRKRTEEGVKMAP